MLRAFLTAFVVAVGAGAAAACLPQNGDDSPSPQQQPTPTPAPAPGGVDDVGEDFGDTTFFCGPELDSDSSRDNPDLVVEDEQAVTDDPLDPTLQYLEPPFIECYDRIDQGLPDDSNVDPDDPGPACSVCQPPANPGSCDYSVVGWYMGWCTSLCTYASACLCTQPDPWNPNQCDGWSDEWALNGCPGPNPCTCQ